MKTDHIKAITDKGHLEQEDSSMRLQRENTRGRREKLINKSFGNCNVIQIETGREDCLQISKKKYFPF